MSMLLALALALAQVAPAAAPAVACPPLPAGYAGWRQEPSAPTEFGAPIRLGVRVAEALTAVDAVRYPVTPDRVPAGAGGIAKLDVPAAGNYAIVASAPVWIDVIQFGTRLVSSVHRMGAACTGIRKTVVFPLAAGQATIQLWGARSSRVDLMVVPER